MGSIIDKLDYTIKSIQDIEKALFEKGISASPFAIGFYGDLIRLIKTDPGIKTGTFGGTGRIIIETSSIEPFKPAMNFIAGDQRVFNGKVPMSYSVISNLIELQKPTMNLVNVIEKTEE